jgi:hypothetical protein
MQIPCSMCNASLSHLFLGLDFLEGFLDDDVDEEEDGVSGSSEPSPKKNEGIAISGLAFEPLPFWPFNRESEAKSS